LKFLFLVGLKFYKFLTKDMNSEIEYTATEFDLALKRVKAGERERSKQFLVFDKKVAARQALAAGLHPQSRRVKKQDEPDLDWEEHPEYDDFDEEEEEEEDFLSNLPAEEDCNSTSELIFRVLMWQRITDLSPEYIRQLYEQRSMMREEERAFIKDCWNVRFRSCH
jgi:hypothetical protein